MDQTGIQKDADWIDKIGTLKNLKGPKKSKWFYWDLVPKIETLLLTVQFNISLQVDEFSVSKAQAQEMFTLRIKQNVHR